MPLTYLCHARLNRVSHSPINVGILSRRHTVWPSICTKARVQLQGLQERRPIESLLSWSHLAGRLPAARLNDPQNILQKWRMRRSSCISPRILEGRKPHARCSRRFKSTSDLLRLELAAYVQEVSAQDGASRCKSPVRPSKFPQSRCLSSGQHNGHIARIQSLFRNTNNVHEVPGSVVVSRRHQPVATHRICSLPKVSSCAGIADLH